MPSFETLSRPIGERDLCALAHLLIDAVDSGAAVSFLPPLTPERSLAWWRNIPAEVLVLVARDGGGHIVGSVQIHPAWSPNQPHRAEISKLLVHRSSRGGGVGRRLMEEADRAAREIGRTLLTLNVKRGAAAETLYRSLGWTHTGSIPGYALNADGTTVHVTELYFKQLRAPAQGDSVEGSPADGK